MDIGDGAAVKARVTAVKSVSGDCIVNTRKGKIIPSYEVSLDLQWEGEDGDGGAVSGTLRFPYLAEENHDEDPDVEVIVDGAGNAAVKRGLLGSKAKLFAGIATWVAELHAGVPLGAPAAEAAAPAKEEKRAEAPKAAVPQAEGAAPKPAAPERKKEREGFGTIRVEERFICRPGDVYECLTDPRRVMAFTQAPAEIDPRVGGKVMMFGGTVHAEILELEVGKRIVQRWRRNEWEDDVWSRLEIDITEEGQGNTVVRLVQSNVPNTDKFGNGGVLTSIESGWKDRIFGMIKRVFGFGHNLFA